MNRKFILGYACQVVLAVVFLLSSWLKLYPIEPFELTLVDSGIVPWSAAPFVARLLIGLEAFLGIALLVNTKYTKLVLRSSLWLTLFFCVYLLLLWWVRGNDVNCGCFGTNFSMTPIESLLKNAVLILLNLIALKLLGVPDRSFKWAYPIVLIGLFSAPFILNPLDGYFSSVDETEYPYELQTDIIPDSIKVNVPFDIEKGDYLIAFLSLTCPHCKVGAQKLWVAKNEYDLPRIHAFFIGNEKEMNKFRFDSNSELSYTMYQEHSFFKFNKGILPTFILVSDGMVLKRWSGSDFTYEEIAKIPTYLE